MVESQFPEVHLIPRRQNDGYAAAVNEGLASTRNREILLLNSDIMISPEQVAALSRIWERLDFPGMVAPLHIEEDGFPQLTWGAYPTTAAERKRREWDRALSNRETWARKALMSEACRTREVDWVSGSCMLFARATAEEIGPWDQNFFLFFEDMDWCLRARELGHKLYHTSEVQVRHIHGASVNQDPESTEIEYRRSQCYFTKKYFGGFRLLLLRFYLTAKAIGRWILGGWSGYSRGASWDLLIEIWQKPGI